MKRLYLFFILLLVVVPSLGQQQRLIVFGGAAWYPSDPLTGRYERGSLAQLAEYVDAWREELGEENLFVTCAPNFVETMPDGYRAYLAMGDSSVLRGVMDYLGVGNVDTAKFKLGDYRFDTLRGGSILVIDRWNYFGDVITESKVANVSGYPVSKGYMESQSRNIEVLRNRMSTPLRILDTAYSTVDQYIGPSYLGGLFHRFQLQTTDADLSLSAIARPNMSWMAGDLYAKDIYRMLVYDNQLAVVEASGALVLEYLEKIYAGRYRTMRNANDDLVQWKLPYFYHESIAGVPYWVNVTKAPWKRIENCDIEPTKIYRIATTSFSTKWFSDKGCKVDMFGEYRLKLLQWLPTADLNELDRVEQWRIIPEKWAAEAGKREIKQMFKKE